MPYVDPIPFGSGVLLAADNFHLVSGFTCHRPNHPEDRFERDVRMWLTDPGTGGAREAVRLTVAEVNLYLDDGGLIGYGAIGRVAWEINGTSVPLWLLHYFGVHTRCRHQPDTPRPATFGRRILGGLLEEVIRRGDCPFFGLYVDPDNPAYRHPDPSRQSLYGEFGFKEIDRIDEGDRRWVRMLRRLP